MVPDAVAQVLGSDPDRAALEALLAELVFQGSLAAEAAGAVLGLSPEESIAWYSGRGHDYVAYPTEELADELSHVDEVVRRHRAR